MGKYIRSRTLVIELFSPDTPPDTSNRKLVITTKAGGLFHGTFKNGMFFDENDTPYFPSDIKDWAFEEMCQL